MNDLFPAPEFGIDQATHAFNAYNRVAEAFGLPVARMMTPARRKAINARLKECGGLDGWDVALEKVAQSPHCTGHNNRGWKASLDFLCRQSSFIKLMEGTYDGNHNMAGSGRSNADTTTRAINAAARTRRPQGGDMF